MRRAKKISGTRQKRNGLLFCQASQIFFGLSYFETALVKSRKNEVEKHQTGFLFLFCNRGDTSITAVSNRGSYAKPHATGFP